MTKSHFFLNSSRSFVFGFALFGVIASAVLVPSITHAQSLLLKSPKTTYNVGDSFAVSLTLDTKGQSINTLSGKIQLPTSHLQILDVRYGNSIVTLWVERPKADASSGAITFTGGIPGGFSGSAGPILSFGVRARAEGSATINLKDIKILLNDGKGTELAATSGTLKLTISKALPKPASTLKEIYAPLPDTVSPESFVPLVSRHPSVAENKYFVSFFAVDKDSGVSGYEVREEPLVISRFTDRFSKDFVKTESPYVLYGQYLAYKVAVRACDQAGNCTDAFVQKTPHPMVVVALVLLLLITSIFITYKLSRLPRRAHRKIV